MADSAAETSRLLKAVLDRLATQDAQLERVESRLELLLADQRGAAEKPTRLRLFLENKLP